MEYRILALWASRHTWQLQGRVCRQKMADRKAGVRAGPVLRRQAFHLLSPVGGQKGLAQHIGSLFWNIAGMPLAEGVEELLVDRPAGSLPPSQRKGRVVL